MIDDITPDEMRTVVALANKGWDACNDEEKSAWTRLHAKAILAKNTRLVYRIISERRTTAQVIAVHS